MTIDRAMKNFSGRVPVFPLPNLVLFPHCGVPLHIFEPRYRQMTADALEGDRLIAMALHQEKESAISQPPLLHPIVGLGKIVAHERLEDGRYLLVLRGISRARLVREEDVDLPYRVGQLELLPDHIPAIPEFDRQTRAEEITSLFGKLFTGARFQQLIQQAMAEDLPLGSICDVIASSLPIEPSLAQTFLDELNSDVRSQMLWQLLKQMEPAVRPQGAAKPFPPGFSTN